MFILEYKQFQIKLNIVNILLFFVYKTYTNLAVIFSIKSN